MTKRDRIVFSTQSTERKRRTITLVIAACVLLGGALIFWMYTAQTNKAPQEKRATDPSAEDAKTPTRGSLPDVTPDKILCDREGGKYVQVPEGTARCLARTQDGGETCSNKSDCESNCLATADSSTTGTGLCDEFVQPAGTRSLVSNGRPIKNVVE